jgi:hypothetical protein
MAGPITAFERPGEVTRPLTARWEFSALPADGGGFRPHTDGMTKRLSLVVSMSGAVMVSPSASAAP